MRHIAFTDRRTAKAFGHFMLGSVFGNLKSDAWCRSNGVPLVKAAGEGVNTAGGFLVPDDFGDSLIALRDRAGLFRRAARVAPMASDHQNWPRRTGGFTAYAVTEGQAITPSDMAFDAISLTARKFGILALMSVEFDEDAIEVLGQELAVEIGYTLAMAEDAAGLNGDGSPAYGNIRGIIPRFEAVIGSGQLAGALDAASGVDTLLEITANDLSALIGVAPDHAMNERSAWIASQRAVGLTFARLGQAGGGFWMAPGADGRMVPYYAGFPILVSSQMPQVTTDLSDKVMILFGDLKAAATLGSRREIVIARSSEHRFAQDQIALKATERFDINVHDIGDATNAGPVVALLGE
jgi:HK97 family phage major capsid protein